MQELPIHADNDPDPTPVRTPKGVIDIRSARGPLPAALILIMCLLRDADQALRTNRDEAQQCIDKAAALLSAQWDLQEPAMRGGARCRLAPWQVERVSAFVDTHLNEKMGLETLAALTRLSVSHFSRAFRSTVGVTPHAYVIRRRIERAQEMIRLTTKPLSEIALDCGLADQAHLNKLFLRVVGVSPGSWRRLHGPAPDATRTERRESHRPRLGEIESHAATAHRRIQTGMCIA